MTEPMIGHMVYFQLKDGSSAARQKLLDACNEHLRGHPGEVYFAMGVLAEDLNRSVNVRDWDVALHIIFNTKTDHNRYQEAERHQRFIRENEANWNRVRVFDSRITA